MHRYHRCAGVLTLPGSGPAPAAFGVLREALQGTLQPYFCPMSLPHCRGQLSWKRRATLKPPLPVLPWGISPGHPWTPQTTPACLFRRGGEGMSPLQTGVRQRVYAAGRRWGRSWAGRGQPVSVRLLWITRWLLVALSSVSPWTLQQVFVLSLFSFCLS